jgi:hypothetical protein
MKVLALTVTAALAAPSTARAMCGCMMRIRPPKPTQQELVAQKILNEASKVALVRDGERTIMTMSNDVKTDLDEFGMIVPVPSVIKKDDVRIVEQAVFTALEQATNPRIVEMYDPDPCPDEMLAMADAEAPASRAEAKGASAARPKKAADYGVEIEAHYDVGEYSIAVLSAKEGAGGGLMEWLNKFHYDVPADAVPMLNSYIKQSMKFFVAKVNWRKVRKGEKTFLRPIQVKYTTPKLMLPVRLGTLNADGPQELVGYFFSPKGRIEALNYQTLRMPTGQDLPLYTKDQFEKTYQAIFDAETKKGEMKVVFVEHVQRGGLPPATYANVGLGWGKPASPGQYDHFTLTRFHFRYDATNFPEDLGLQETADVQPFSVRYQVHHQARNVQCEAGKQYLASLPPRRQKEAEALAALTLWDLREIREKMGLAMIAPDPAPVTAPPPPAPATKPWWQVW